VHEADYIVLGGGLAGLCAANELQDRAIVLERADRPGGLVRTECFDGYWFDHVIHLLYFEDPATEKRIHRLLGDVLAPCRPTAWVETKHGQTLFPLQMHLAGLDRPTVLRCLRDLKSQTFGTQSDVHPTNFEELLLRTFGRGLCETFFFPYNRKVWKRPLSTLATSDFTWNIATPDYEQVLKGASDPDPDYQAYNADGWYPRPPGGAPLRGMEVLSEALANNVTDLRLAHTVESIDLATRVVLARWGDRVERFLFRAGCLSTLPLPVAVSLCQQAPTDLRRACRCLTRNRVRTVAISVRGPRPQNRGHWRYYSDESVIFSRLVHMHEFDALTAPADGWGLMAEVTEPGEEPEMPEGELVDRVRADLRRVTGVPDDCSIVGVHVLAIDPAYVVFTTENQPVIEAARQFLGDHDVTPLGRYGRWEYSSMAQVMRDGFTSGQSAVAATVERTASQLSA